MSRTQSRSRPSILIADDSEIVQAALEGILADLRCNVLTALTGEEALDIASQRSVALLILDINMPGIDGMEVARRLHANVATRSIPILFLTGDRVLPSDRLEGYGLGAVDYLTKPVPDVVLLSKARVFIDLHYTQMELRRSNRALEEFAHAAAHDLKAPLRHIRVCSELLRDVLEDDLPEEGNDILHKLMRPLATMNELIDSLLLYSKIGGSDLGHESVALGDVVGRVLQTLETDIDAVGAVIEQGELPTVPGHQAALGQLFQNLVGNALKYRREGVRPAIQIAAERRSGSMWRISVQDNGIGFPQGDAQALFVPFRRLVRAADFEGSGLGMATAKRIVELHGGEISAHGVVGQGARFDVLLPCGATAC